MFFIIVSYRGDEVCFRLARGLFFFFKQKTAYEMRISDWSSDVCSSDLTDDTPAPVDSTAASHGDHDGDGTATQDLNSSGGDDAAGDGDGAPPPAGKPVTLAMSPALRSEVRRVGKECVSTCRSGESRSP